jgi:hypothetical protein
MPVYGDPAWAQTVPFEAHDIRGSKRPTAAILGALLVLMVVGFRIFFVVHWVDHASKIASASTNGAPAPAPARIDGTQLAADGRSNLPGGGATIRYKPVADDFEVTHDANAGGGPHDDATWSVLHWDPGEKTRTVLELHHYIFVPPPTMPADIDHLVARESMGDASNAGHQVTPTRGRTDGRTSYTWNYVSKDHRWNHVIWVFAPTHSYRIYCLTPVDDKTGFRQRCMDAVKTLKIKTKD